MIKRKNIVGSLFLSLLVALAVSCSSNDKKDDGTSPDVAEATSDSGVPPDPSATGDQPPADGANGDQAANLDAPPADPNAAPAAPGAGGDMASADQPPADPNSPPPGDTPPADPNAAPAAPSDQSATTAPPADATPPATADSGATSNNTDVFGASGAGSSGSDAATGEEPPKKKHVALAHIKDAPFTKGGQNLNTVYIARDGDTLDAISQKLFGEDRTKDLKKANPTLKKGVKTGDKVYFNSPNRADDKEKMLTVYEDQGLPPSVYTTKDGDTLKSLAQEWYGSEASYKEIYAINKSLTSTTDLPAGTELQYWPASATVAVYGAKKEADVAEANPPGGPGAQTPPPPGMGGGNTAPPPPPPTMAQNNPPGGPAAPGAALGGMPGMDNTVPPPGMGAGSVNNNNGNLPPPPGMGAGAPPPDMNAAVPPPAPPAGRHKTKDLGGTTGAMDKDTIFYAGLAGILLISSALWFALRRRRSRNSGVTQI